MANATAFFTGTALQVARSVSANTHIPVSVLLAQMSIETGYGTSNLWLNCHNPAGIGGSAAGACAGFAAYPTYQAAAQGYANFYLDNSNYGHVLQVARQGGSPNAVAVALGQSPWAGSHYVGDCGSPGCQLIQQINTYHLTQYDVSPTPVIVQKVKKTPTVLVPVLMLSLGLLGVGTDITWIHDQRTGRWF